MRLTPPEWLEVDEHYASQVEEKHRLLLERADDIVQSLPESLEAQRECLGWLRNHLSCYHPSLIGDDGEYLGVLEGRFHYRIADFESAPLDLAARLIQDDLCLMAPDGPHWRLVAASLAFPSRWRLSEKLGKPITGIHQPVPEFNRKLAPAVDRFFGRLTPEQPYYRLNWSVMDDPTLFQPSGHGRTDSDGSVTPENAGERLYVRIERQSFQKLPETGVVVFGIKTIVDPLSVLSDKPGLANALLGSIESLPPAMARYKSILPFGDAVRGWLACTAAKKEDPGSQSGTGAS